MDLPKLQIPLPPGFREGNFFTKKNIITFLLVSIALLVIPFSVKLVQQQQFFRSKAAAEPSIVFKGEGVSCDSTGSNCTSIKDTFQVEFYSPLGPPATSSAGSGQ